MMLRGQGASTISTSGALECSPYLTAAAERAKRISVSFTDTPCGGSYELAGFGRRFIAFDADAAHSAYGYLLNLETAPVCRAVAEPARAA